MLYEDVDSLLNWYELNQRTLPWRETLDGYAVMVSEFMLQQTTVAAVEKKYTQWMHRFPSFEALASADESAVFSQWSGLGYYQRARRLHQAAKEVARLGYLPDTYEELLSLPGVGPYTAAAVSSICFGRPKLAVDTNVIRVLYRYYALARTARQKSAQDDIRQRMAPLLESRDPGQLNQALMELGATVCSVRDPGCLLCPLSGGCAGRIHQEGPTSFPVSVDKRKPKQTLGRAFVITLIEEESVLLVKGTGLGLLSPLYQPPILFSARESSEEFFRSVAELPDLLPPPEEPSGTVKYGISGRRLLLDCPKWRVETSLFCQLEDRLRKGGLLVERYRSQVDDERVPVSTLTRKILKRCRGNR